MLEQLEWVSCVFFFVQIGHSQNYDIEVLAGNDSSVIEMDLMLVYSCEGVAAA